MATQIITMDSDKTVEINGKLYTLTPHVTNATASLNGSAVTSGTPITITQDSNIDITGNAINVTFNFPDTVTMSVNEVSVKSGQTITLTDNSNISVTQIPQTGYITFNYGNLDTMTYDDGNIASGQKIAVTSGEHTISATGATKIPEITINGDGLSKFTINETEFSSTSLPYTFTPLGGITTQIFAQGQDTGSKSITISGTHIAAMTVNNNQVSLPYTTNVTEPLDISVAGEIYQVDLTSVGGAQIAEVLNGKDNVITTGNAIHRILDIDKDTYIEIDGTHNLQITGTDISTISVNGVSVPIEQLPYTLTNKNMTAYVNITGYPPSEIHVSGTYIDTATLDGNPLKIGANGNIDMEVTVRDENHFLTVIGSQPREYGITWNDHGSTTISMDGLDQTSGATSYISDSVYVESISNPIPVNFDSDEFTIVEINGRPYTGTQFTTNVQAETFVSINSSSCRLTIDYVDNSYNITVPQGIVTITAPHQDGWIFDTWTSNDTGIINPRSVKCQIDTSGLTTAHIVANYQRYITMDKPTLWQ